MRQSINVMFLPETEGLVPFKSADDLPPKYYTAVQSWVLCFLTTPGSRLLEPSYGTYFLTLLRNGNLFTKDDVYSAFAEAAAKCYHFCTPDSFGDTYVTEARITDLDIEEVDSDLRLVIYVAFTFSDGVQTRINLEV